MCEGRVQSDGLKKVMVIDMISQVGCAVFRSVGRKSIVIGGIDA